jgi:long-chain acyl-CoA synthetase
LQAKIGRPFHGVNYKLVNCNADGEGELAVKSPTIHVREIIGGVEKPTTLDEEGYFKTGDIALIDETNRVSLKGRIKDVIINADGENVFPDELEIFFKSLPHVKHLSILGVADGGNHKEKIVLVLETDDSVSDEELKQIQTLIKEIEVNLPHNVKIGDVYLAKGKLPLANNMKVKRFVIKGAIESGSDEYVLIGQKKEVKTFKGFDDKTVDEILIPMRKIFSKVLILPEFKIQDNSHWINDLGGDSMSYVELINEIQDHFDVTLPEEVLGQLACINEFVEQVALLKKDANK